MNDPCTCMLFDGPELLRMWRRRATPIIRRWLSRGRRLDQRHFAATVRLILLIDCGSPEVTSPENASRSHHRLVCPCSNRKRCAPVDTMSTGVLRG